MKRTVSVFLLAAFLFFPTQASARSARRATTLGGMYGYVSVAGGQTLKDDRYDKDHMHAAYSFASGVGIPFVRLEGEYLTIDRRSDDPDNYRRVHAVFTNLLLGEIVYGGVGWGLGDWGDSSVDLYQWIGGVEIPLGRHVRIGAEYHYVRSYNEPEEAPSPLRVQAVMARLRVNF